MQLMGGRGEKLETAFRRKKEKKKRCVGKSYNYNEKETVSFCKEYGSAKTGPHSPPTFPYSVRRQTVLSSAHIGCLQRGHDFDDVLLWKNCILILSAFRRDGH